ncbi:SHOCT domain-containing protein [Mucilaginibacter sp.]|uniref:SHOCT domain-containing protein n=1 Tax=Mucilaginibacter sp. TaxID=1882438 RepID=UPI002851EA03|nr:SHOCT domain-containing protein [Mucilaginibacter sp.]MDR3693034.1 SHOCT domain-containing protein [Mucilaginibacter sp.]
MLVSQIILIVIMHGLVFGVACYFIGAQKEIGPIASGFLGLILGFIGLIIVLASSRKQVIPFNIQLQHFKQLLDNGTISEAEYNHLKGRLIEQQ